MPMIIFTQCQNYWHLKGFKWRWNQIIVYNTIKIMNLLVQWNFYSLIVGTRTMAQLCDYWLRVVFFCWTFIENKPDMFPFKHVLDRVYFIVSITSHSKLTITVSEKGSMNSAGQLNEKEWRGNYMNWGIDKHTPGGRRQFMSCKWLAQVWITWK